MYSHAELLEMITPNTEMRDDSLIRCKYFGQCAGCQYQVCTLYLNQKGGFRHAYCVSAFQMLPYQTQLGLKQEVLVKAYQNFSGKAPNLTFIVMSANRCD